MMTSRAVYLGICGLLLAGIIHIVVILLIPHFGSRDAARKIMNSGTNLQFDTLNAASGITISDHDPFFRKAVCRYDLSEAGVRISGNTTPGFWSASVFDAQGRVVYSLNDRTAIKQKLELIIVNPVQMADIRQIQPEEVETSILVETTNSRGYIVLRALVRDESLENQAKEFLDSASCTAYQTR
jgi:uncharacterized membrane protein